MEWIAQIKLRINHIIHLLDDFLIIAKSESFCQNQLYLFFELPYLLVHKPSPHFQGQKSNFSSFWGK